MKTHFYPYFLALFFIFSCSKTENGFQNLSLNVKTPKGPMKEKEVKGDFDEIQVSAGIDAEVIKSDFEKVIISAPENILNDVEASISGGVLSVKIKPGFRFNGVTNIKAKIFAKDFKEIEATSGASIHVKDKFLQEITNISVSSAGSIDGHLEANDLKIDASSGGNFSGTIWAINFRGDTSSSGLISAKGNVKKAIVGVSSGGSFDGDEIIADEADLDASSGASISIGVKNVLKADANSGGSISVSKKGNLKESQIEENSGGSVSVN